MKKITIAALLGACTVASTAAQADTDKAPYGAIMGSYLAPDTSRDANFGKGGVGLVGMPLTDHLAVELNAWGNQIKRASDGGKDSQYGIGPDLNINLSNGKVALFGLAGLGAEYDYLRFSPHPKVVSPFIDFGGGFMVRLAEHFAFRAEAKYYNVFNHRSDPGDNNIGDIHVNAGLLYSFGTVIPSNVPQPVAPPPPPPPAPVAALPPPPPPPPAPPPCPNASHGFKVDANCHVITQTLVLHSVNFEFNSDKLTPYAKSALDEVALGLAGQNDLQVEVGGHTDSKGTAAYNKKLSQRRAEAVKQYLVAKGVTAPMTAVGYGEDKPVASNKTEAGRAENRRVEFKVQGPAGEVQNQGGSVTIQVPVKK
jgi:outer membrane protein OmpA-like peptidoglycan-associated protein